MLAVQNIIAVKIPRALCTVLKDTINVLKALRGLFWDIWMVAIRLSQTLNKKIASLIIRNDCAGEIIIERSSNCYKDMP